MSTPPSPGEEVPALAELLAVGDRVVAQVRPGEQLEAVLVRGHDTEIKVYEQEIESFSSAQSQGVGIRVVNGGRQGLAYAPTFDESDLVEALAAARDNAEFATVDEHQGLAEPDGVAIAELDLYRESVRSCPTETKIEMAFDLERQVRGADARISGIESAEYVDASFEGAIVSSSGIRNAGRETSAHVAAYALASDGDETQTGFGYSVGREPAEIDIGRAARDAADRATRLLGATKPSSERSAVVLDPWVTAQFLSIIGWTLNGEALIKGRSLFADRLGEEVAATCVTLIDDPTDEAAYSATDVDGEGLATRRNVLIGDGVLESFVHNAYTARCVGTTSTGSAVRGYKSSPGVGIQAVSLVPGRRTQSELLASMQDGILIQEVTGLHSGVNPVSGDFSTGAEGLRVKDGALAEPLREFTVASTLQRMLLDVTEVGSDLEWLPMSAAGVSLVLSDVTVSGT